MTDTTDKPTLKDIADKDKPAPDAAKPQEKGGTQRKSGGGFVWFVLILVIMGGAVAAGWPYIGPRVEPLLSWGSTPVRPRRACLRRHPPFPLLSPPRLLLKHQRPSRCQSLPQSRYQSRYLSRCQSPLRSSCQTLMP